jgi:hypothetical protein
MTYIDSIILNLAEWACRKFQRLTGRTNVWLALQLTNLSIIVYFVWAGMYSWSSDAVPRTLVALFCGGLLYVLTQTIFKVPIEAYEVDAYRRVAKGFRNPRRVRDALLRISFLTLSLALWYPTVFVYVNLRLHVVLLSYSLVVLTTVVLYLLACDPLPPCAGKVSEWLRSSAPSRPTAADARVKALRSGYANRECRPGSDDFRREKNARVQTGTSSSRHEPVRHRWSGNRRSGPERPEHSEGWTRSSAALQGAVAVYDGRGDSGGPR